MRVLVFSTGSTLQGRDINNSNNEILPQNANTTAGSPVTETQVVTVNESQKVNGTMDCRHASGTSYWTQRDRLTLSIAFDGLVIYDKVSYPAENAEMCYQLNIMESHIKEV